ncbi:hypothetical protein [Brachyspira intermedia]|uniref:hypothetical protein n=1 Tax=Brachyspira intermedia TaxID=84377 RepID=UPI0011D2931E|nr:hypothetical protein [Brachyspira intermedia]
MFDLLFFNSRLAITAKPSQAKPSQAKPSQAKPSQAKPSQANNINSLYDYQSSKKICLILFKIFYNIKNVNKINKYKILIKFIDSNNKKLYNNT